VESPAILLVAWLRLPYATAAAFTTAQAFHVKIRDMLSTAGNPPHAASGSKQIEKHSIQRVLETSGGKVG
jgi:hypothetical protein